MDTQDSGKEYVQNTFCIHCKCALISSAYSREWKWHCPCYSRATAFQGWLDHDNTSVTYRTSTFQHFITAIADCREAPREPWHCKMDARTIFSARGRWCWGKQTCLLFTSLPTKVWNKISSCLKSRAAVLLRMIRHATELYHGNYIRNKFTIGERRKITRSNPPKQLQCHSWEICREEKCITQEQLRMNSRWEGLCVHRLCLEHWREWLLIATRNPWSCKHRMLICMCNFC